MKILTVSKNLNKINVKNYVHKTHYNFCLKLVIFDRHVLTDILL